MLNYMRMFGMSISAYHFSLYLTELLITQTISGCLLGLGIYLGGSSLYKAIDPKIIALLWYLAGASNISISLLISTIVPSLAFGNILINVSSILIIIDFAVKLVSMGVPGLLPNWAVISPMRLLSSSPPATFYPFYLAFYSRYMEVSPVTS